MLVLALLVAAALGVREALLPDPAVSAAGRTGTDRSSGTSSPHPTTSPPRSGPTGIYANTRATDFSPAVHGDPELVYVPEGAAGMVQVIDAKTFKIVKRFTVGSYPEHVTPSWDLTKLYVDVSASSKLVVIDPRTGTVTRTIAGIDHPYNLYFTPDGTKAIVVVEYYNRLDFRDPHTWKLIKSVSMPCSGPDHADFSPDGSYFLISCEFDGIVVKVDAEQMKVLEKIDVGGLPVDIKISPDGSAFYVANQGTNGVSVVDAATDRVIKFIRTGKGAHGFAVSRDGHNLYLSNRLAGTISVISFASRAVVATWHVGGSPDM